jgi:methionyl aminopeptidase
MIELKNKDQLELMRQAGRIVAEVLEIMREMVKPGVTTEELDKAAEKHIRECKAIPAFKGYNGFPASLCTSVNEEVVHGIPGLRALKNGDIISIDCGAIYKGYVGDAAITLPVGEISTELANLLAVTSKSLELGIVQARKGKRLQDISYAIQSHVEKNGMSVVRDYVGHGIGRKCTKNHRYPTLANPAGGRDSR